MMHQVSVEIVRARLDFDPTSGFFKWKLPPINRPELKGQIAGRLAHTGYWNISINGQRFQAHRLAWLYVFGQMPVNEIDHVNGDRADNRIINLREATRQQNNWNISKPSHNTSDVKGVTWHKSHNKWQARIGLNGDNIHLGYFQNINDAQAAYSEASSRLHGKFARAA
jgi:HNH endonuclease/AP2 domain